ncbi:MULTISPECIES: MBL fold metallo-hydrolase [Paraliobacillus]|uniref:MBL fold metallo-hydrolase n=1 Tax=Paraliobacillus TaxID=200903 RepID=UPI000DD4DC29|nr:MULTISPECIES: MBL fold metallo-hydrolase [Paraliobacillus]
MKVTVVGFWGAYPEIGEATSSFLLEKDDFSCLIDCGSGVLAQLPKYTDPMELDAVILSHYHNDHIADIGVLQYNWLVQNQIHNTSDILPIYGHTDDKTAFEKLTHHFTEGIGYDPERTLQVGPFTITFLKTEHPVTCYAMRITDGDKVIVYTADSSYMRQFISFSKNANLLIADCSFYQGQDGSKAGHMNSLECATIAEAAGVRQLLLSHHPHFGDRTDLVKEAKQKYSGIIALARSSYIWDV